MIKRGRPWHKWKSEIIEAVNYFSFSEYFHWTPEQTDSLNDLKRMAYTSLMDGTSKAKPKE